MVQSAAAYSHDTAATLREDLIEAYLAHAPLTGELARNRAAETFVLVNHTRWMPPNTVVGSYAYNHAEPEDFRPSEWTTLEVHEKGEGGLQPETVRAVAEVGFGLAQPHNNCKNGDQIYHLSSYGRSDAPSWDFSDPNQSGLDYTRPAEDRDVNVQAYLDGEPYAVPGHEGLFNRDCADISC